MAAPVLQFKRGSYANLPGLRSGEPGFTTDKHDLFVGISSLVSTNKFFGSARYWKREDATNAAQLKLVDKDGTNSLSFQVPNTLSGVGTYVFPDSVDGAVGDYLKISQLSNGVYTLVWDTATSGVTYSNATFTGITTIGGDNLDINTDTNLSGINTFSNTTDNTLGNVNTGAVQIDGGLGVEKNVTVGGNLNVQGYSEFVGVVTFRGGTVNIGDSSTDNINVSGEFISNLSPNTDNTYDIGISTQKWRDAYFAGIGSFSTGAYIDQLRLGITAASEIDTVSGNLIFDSATGQTVIDDNLSVTGVATVTGAFFANGNITLGDAAGDTITVNGTTTFAQNLTLTGDIAINGGDATTTATTFNLINGTATSVNFGGAASALVMGATTGVATIRNAAVAFPNATSITVDGANPTFSGASTGTLTFFNTNLTSVNAFGAATGIVIGAATGITTIRNNLTVDGDVRINGNDIQASDGNVNISLQSNTLTEVKGNLQVTGNNIRSSTGANVITLSSNNATFQNDLTVTGNLYVNGSTTQVNTTSLTVEDRVIELGLVDGSTPSSATTWDLGVLFNYNLSGAKKAGLVWDQDDQVGNTNGRFVFASQVSDSGGTGVDNPQITFTAYAPIEIDSLWINNACSGGSQEVIGCLGGELKLQNITIDAGTF